MVFDYIFHSIHRLYPLTIYCLDSSELCGYFRVCVKSHAFVASRFSNFG